MHRCSICKTLIQISHLNTVCPHCDSAYHRECWKQLGGCATYGCSAAAIPEQVTLPVSVRGGWGDEKMCPQCGESIPSSLLVCRCKARFPWADPMTRQEYETWVREEDRGSQARKGIVMLFILSLFGLPAPLTGTIAGIYAYRTRRVLAGGAGVYLALGYGAATIAVVYSLIFLLLYLGK